MAPPTLPTSIGKPSNKQQRGSACSSVLFFLVVAGSAYLGYLVYMQDNELKTMREQLQQSDKRVAELSKQLPALEGEVARLVTQEAELRSVQTERDQLKGEKATCDSELESEKQKWSSQKNSCERELAQQLSFKASCDSDLIAARKDLTSANNRVHHLELYTDEVNTKVTQLSDIVLECKGVFKAVKETTESALQKHEGSETAQQVQEQEAAEAQEQSQEAATAN